MGIRRHCDNHPDRAAIGVCVETGRAICAECSTRYEGVNYSREGLEALQRRRAAEQRAGGWGLRLLSAVAVACVPLFGFFLYAFLHIALQLLVDIVQSGGYGQ